MRRALDSRCRSNLAVPRRSGPVAVPEATGSRWTPVSSSSAHREGHYGPKPVRAHRTTASPNQDYGIIASPRRSGTMPDDAEPQGRTEGGSTTPPTHRVSSFQGMDVVEVEGEAIAPEEVTKEAGWLTSHRNRSRRAIEQFSIMADETSKTTGTGEARSGACQSAARTTKKPKPPRQPQLPREDIKIIVRPRDGLNVSKLSDAQIRDEVLRAAAVPIAEAEDDIYRSCVEKNVIVISTPRMANAEKYNRIRELQIGDTHYEATAYAAPPADTYKGVIHNIPDYDTAEDITKSLIYKKNPTILQARRMGNTNSAIIIFEGPNVPFYVYYRGAEYRCYLHKKKVEVCGACGRIGHRADVCPTPDKKQCKDCGAQNPADNHSCNPKCALCGKDHPTGDKSCQRRFQTPFLIKQRQWEKQRQQQQQTLHNHSGGGGRDPSLPRQADKQTTAAQRPSRSKSRDTAADRKASRSRSPSGHRPQAKQESKTSTNNNKVSWANVVSQSEPTKIENPTLPSSHDSELTKIKQMLEILLTENKALKAEVAQLKATPPKEVVPAEPETVHIEIDAPPAVAEPTTQYAQPDSDTESLPAKRRAVEQSPPSQGTTAHSGTSKRNIREETIIEEITRAIDIKFEIMHKTFHTMITNLAESYNARIAVLENAQQRPSVGPIKVTKPYNRPTNDGLE
ncbi:hypothetical protein HPB49_010400 [Dermacentor silvarum]|uniref:Uncharacterized protein n=1 Tax=Dermacentor silvarum TaxID=543639 RepID=A0ACB8DZ56_DERSI|nr:hypothetical protein HPB49_010400 [Dermacentor silvarum]